MQVVREDIPEPLKSELKAYVYDVIGAMHEVYRHLGNGLPEYVYQEALCKELQSVGYADVMKEYQYHLTYKGEELNANERMDFVVPKSRGNIIIECKSIENITSKERYQTFGYLTATHFPIAILVNFGAYPRAQIEKYYAKDGKIRAF